MAGKKEYLNEKHILRLAMIESDAMIKDIAAKIGIKATTLSNQLGRKESTLTLTSFFAILDSLGYEITIRKRNKGSAYVLKDITESSAEWDQKVASARYEKEMREIQKKEQAKNENIASMRESMKK